jgi:hypothetical protein
MFEIGNKVKVVKAFEENDDIEWMPEMDKTIGLIGVVDDVYDDPYEVGVIFPRSTVVINKDEIFNVNGYLYLPESLELVEE